jgi:serine/threonine protein kinase
VKVGGRKFIVARKLAEGGFSFVFIVKDAETKTKYALKRVRIQLPEHERVSRIHKLLTIRGRSLLKFS